MSPSTSARGNKCKKRGCKSRPTTGIHCRMHYIAFWAEKKEASAQQKGLMLDHYIQAITQRYPDKYLEIIKRDLSSEVSFEKTVKGLGLSDFDDADVLKAFHGAMKLKKRKNKKK